MAGTLDTLYVDVVQRGLKEVMDGLKAVTGQADKGTQSIKQMRDALQHAGNASRGMSTGGGGGGGGGASRGGGLSQAAGGMVGGVLAPAAIGAAAMGSVRAADPGAFEQIGVVLHDLAGTVGQLLAPAVRSMVPILRAFSDAIAGVADAFKPVMTAITGAVVPVIAAVGKAFGEHAQVMASIVLPVVQQLAKMLAPLGQVFMAVLGAVMPLVQALFRMQSVLVGMWLGVISAVLPAVRVLAEVLAGLGTVVGEVVSLVADAFGALLSVFGELLSPVMEFVQLLAGALVQAIKAAVVGFRLMIDVVRAVFGLSRKPIGDANSVGRGMMNDTGTEDANSTFQRIQQAILKAGAPAEKGPEEEAVDELREMKAKLDTLISVGTATIVAINSIKDKPRDFVEGTKLAGAAGVGAISSFLGGLVGR